MDIEDLRAALEGGATVKEAAEFLCRSDSADDIARKCEERRSHDRPEADGVAKPKP